MTASSIEGSLLSNRPDKLTVGFLFRFSLPLALTFLMMAGSAPIVSIGIARMHDADGERLHLSAFLLTFACSLFIYSPMFIARNVAIRTVTDRRSLFRYAGFFLTCASVSSVILVLVSQVDVLGHFFFGTLLDTELKTELLARRGMLVFVPIPILIALRGLGHACHINNNQTWYVGTGTALRLMAMAIFVFGYAIHRDISGPVLGGLTYLAGIGTETFFVLVTLRGKPPWITIGDGPLLSYGQFARYVGPLMLASALTQCTGLVLLYLINNSRHPGENGAAFDLIRDTGWMMFSMLNAIQPAIVTFATSKHNFKIIMRFGILLTLMITGVAMLVALTPLRVLIFVDGLKVDNELILRLTYVALLWIIMHPIVNLINLSVSAMHTRSGRTVWVTIGNVVALGALLGSATGLDLSTIDGVVLAVVGGAAFNLIAALVQLIGLRKGGVRAAITPVSLAETLNQFEESELDIIEAAQPMPERVQA